MKLEDSEVVEHLFYLLTWGLGYVQDRILTIEPPPQEALQGVAIVDQGLKNKYMFKEDV
jgi:hypothetical protein